MSRVDLPDAESRAAAREGRRWLIGVSISVVFGLFGALMALLGYLEAARPAQPAGAKMPATGGHEPASPRNEQRRPRERRK